MTRILVVEDEASIAFTLKADLSSEGYDVSVAPNGTEAIRLVREGDYGRILLDVMLPGRDGFDVCRDLRKMGISTPIVMLTARSQEAEKVMGLDLGADDYITKPFSPHELRARVRAAIRRGSSASVEIIRFGDAEVDFTRGEVRRGGQPIDVTALEFRLLSTFVRSRGRLLSREQLVEAAWGRGVSLNDRVVDNHIVSLRRKIEPDPREPRFLVNVRGLGYRFEA